MESACRQVAARPSRRRGGPPRSPGRRAWRDASMRAEAVLRAGLVVAGLGLFALALAEVPADPLPPRAPDFAPASGALLADGFEDGRLAGWRADRNGVWSVRSGMLEARLPDARQQHSFLYAGDSTWTDYA